MPEYKTLDDLLSIGKYLVLNFNIEWCHNCREFEPIFIQVAHEFKPNVKFALIDAETCYNVLDELKIDQLPTTVYVKDKEIKFTHIGKMSAEEFREKVNKLCKFH